MDAFTQQRILSLRDEIASIQRENSRYRLDKAHNQMEMMRDEARKYRLLAIREELRIMVAPERAVPADNAHPG
jgi:hypothetical protein